MRLVTFKIDEKYLEKLDRYAKYTGKNRSELIRDILVDFLTKVEKGEKHDN